jgi:protein-tyrosine phosphatase
MFNSILVVCVGNICRSPALERMLRQALPGKVIQSAGLGALVGKPINTTMANLMAAGDINVEDHAARQLDARLLRDADLVIAMEAAHISSIRARFPEASGKLMLAAQWLGGVDVADPYRKNDAFFEACYKQLQECADSWASRL